MRWPYAWRSLDGMNRHRHRLADLAAGVLLAAPLVTACNTSGQPTSSPPSIDDHELLVAYAQCMRDHGFPQFPDPTDDGIDLNGTGIDTDTETFQTAQRECEEILPAPGTGQGEGMEQNHALGWEKVVPGGDCECSDGSEFSFWVRDADPRRVLIYFPAGGACFTAELCDPANDIYNTTADNLPPPASGVFDRNDGRNPFADYSVIYVPYCSGDVFLGNTTTTYAAGLTIRHKGFVNGTAALERVVTAYPEATDIVVAGGSAGSVAAPVYGGLVAERLPDARVTVISDSSGSYTDVADLNAQMTAAWHTDEAINALTTGETTQWSIPGLFALSGQHHPRVVFARHDYAYDRQQADWFPRVGLPTGDLLEYIDSNEGRIEASGVNVHSYIAPGAHHVALNDDRFYTETVNGHALVDWVARLLAGEPVPDVHCTQCRN